jgi:hypothetical protein
MKKVWFIIFAILLIAVSTSEAWNDGWISKGAETDTDCDIAKYYADGILCQDTDDNKLYLGTGAAVLQILSATSIGTIATQNADNATITGGNATGLTNLGAANLTVTGTANVTGATWTGLTVGSVTGAAATADLAEDLSTASHSIYKDSAGNITDIITAIDAHAANTTITLIPGICATIHNSAQGDANAVSTLPALADGLCFTGLVVTTEDDKTFRLNAAAANTICLGATCGKDDIGFATGQNTKGGMFKCLGIGADWFCHTITGTVDAGDL